MTFKKVLLMAMSLNLVAGQRPSFAGSRPIGFPEVIKTTTDSLNNRFGEDDTPTTTMRLPLEANGDRDLVERLSKLPVDQQPFWFINWQALEQHRKNPQTFEQKPNVFVDPPNSNQQRPTQQQFTQQTAGQQQFQQRPGQQFTQQPGQQFTPQPGQQFTQQSGQQLPQNSQSMQQSLQQQLALQQQQNKMSQERQKFMELQQQFFQQQNQQLSNRNGFEPVKTSNTPKVESERFSVHNLHHFGGKPRTPYIEN